MSLTDTEKNALYEKLYGEISSLMDPECGALTNYANFTAALYHALGCWWCGFYFVRKDHLELGPFQGPVACTRIGYGKGVCGKAWALRTSIVVPDVHVFEGHIACSAESNSEIVVPLKFNDEVFGVLDIDSREFGAFNETDRIHLEKLVSILPAPEFNS